MQQIVNFILRNKNFLLFLLLFSIAFFLTIQSHSYHKSKFVNSANFITGGIHKRVNSFKEFTYLKVYNEQLLEENTRLKNILSQRLNDSIENSIEVIDTVKYFQKYSYLFAKVIHNQYHNKYNYLTIDKGSRNGVQPDQGIINSKGIIGITNSVSNNYATILSILNSSSRINVKLKNGNHFGSLIWNGEDYALVQIIDIPRQAKLKKGDTIITGGKSALFPEGINVGTVDDIIIKNHQYQKINVRLFNDMSAIGQVQIVKNLHKEELLTLEEKSNNE